MSTLKPGTLVMVVTVPPDSPGAQRGIRVGTCGTVQDPAPFIAVLKAGRIVVEFPYNPSTGTTGLWSILRKNVIPINDPDADITQEENDVLYTPQGKIAHMK